MNDHRAVTELADQDDDFDRWYLEVVRKAELADDAPVQVIVIPFWRSPEELARVEEAVTRITERLAPTTRVRVDWREDRTPGFRFNGTQCTAGDALLVE